MKITTLAEAQKQTYGHWHPHPYRETDCVENVGRDMGRYTSFGQCSRKKGHGPEGLYCKGHAERLFPSGEITVRWRLSKWSSSGVESFKTIGETEKQWKLADGSREAKTADTFATEAEAYRALLERQEGKLRTAQKAVDKTRAKLMELEGK